MSVLGLNLVLSLSTFESVLSLESLQWIEENNCILLCYLLRLYFHLLHNLTFTNTNVE